MDHVTKYVCLFMNIFVFSFKSHHINPPARGHHCRHRAPQRLPTFGPNRSSSSTHHDNITTHNYCHIAATTHVQVIAAARRRLRRPRHRRQQPPATTSLPTTHAHATSPTTTTHRRHIATRAPSPQGMWAPHHCHPPN